MSKFSSKYDFADFVQSHNVEDILKSYKIFLGWNIIPLKFEIPADLVPYYPYLTIVEAYDKDNVGIVRLSERSFIDQEEKRILEYDLKQIKMYWQGRKIRRKEFEPDYALQCVAFNQTPHDYQVELVDRVAKYGNKADIGGLHCPLYDMCRKYLYEEMLQTGWDEEQSYAWCFGLDRLFKRKEGDRP